MKEIVTNKCEGCGGVLSYNPEKTALTCSHCANEVSIESELSTNAKQPFNETTVPKEYSDLTVQYFCSHCQKRHSHTDTNELTKCPSCGSSSIEKTFDIKYQPDAVVPFKYSKEQASEMFTKWLGKKKLCPNSLKKEADVNHLKGVYYPAWNFSCDVSTTYSGIGVYTTGSSDNRKTHREHITGKAQNTYDNHLTYACPQNDLFASVTGMGSFGYNKMLDFKPEFLYGYDANETKFSLQDSWDTAKSGISSLEARKIQNSLKFNGSRTYDRIENFKSTSSFFNPRYNLIYIPLYEIKYKFKDKLFSCYMNGFSGFVQGKVPVSPVKIAAIVLGILLGAGLIGLLISLFS